DMVGYSLIVEQVGRGDSSARTVVSVQTSLVCGSIETWGTEEQKHEWLPRLCSGEALGCFGLTEPDTGSDAANLSTRATKVDGGWKISGQKQWISLGNFAKLALVFAQTDPDQKHRGLACFLVPTDSPGFSSEKIHGKLGLRSSDTAELSFTDVKVPVEDMLGEPGKAFTYLTHNLPQERLGIAIGAYAMSAAAVRFAHEYVKERTVFGREVASFQNTKFVLADCKADVDAMQAVCDRALDALDLDELTPADAASAKLFTTELAAKVIDKCLQLHGGYGYMLEYPVANLYADTRVSRIYGGTSEVMRSIVAKSMGL
ncbi:MAG: acyl-CoA dehydrogenase family protein, partial [Streptomyces sp.]|uniref:acyl-CoA dehydrogenase family protein n=1 Tax=Streptomyces sp. TaxID=1931 RepID=UPI003D6C6323